MYDSLSGRIQRRQKDFPGPSGAGDRAAPGDGATLINKEGLSFDWEMHSLAE
jgi:hypothetical protein